MTHHQVEQNPMNKTAPYGSWKSPITADLIVNGAVGLSQPAIDEGDIYWLELRPAEGGRQVIVKRDKLGQLTDINPQSFNARTRVHEYGGGDYLVSNGTVYFSNFVDQRLYKQVAGEAPQPITPAAEMRYADAIIDNVRKRLICVREDHTVPAREAVNTLVSLSADANRDCGEVLVAGNDFYSTPRLSPDGHELVWLTWNHPNMPWDGTELWQAHVETDGSLSGARLIAGGKNESILQPQWSPDGQLYFISDRSGWWNLYRLSAGQAATVTELTAELGVPHWVFGLSCYAFASSQQIVCIYYVRGMARLAVVDTKTLELQPVDVPYTDLGFVRAASGQAVFRAGSSSTPPAIVRLDLQSREVETLRSSNNLNFDPGYLSTPEAIEFPTTDGLTAHGFYYAPQNRDYQAPENELPPLLVKSHGGPTSAAATALSLYIQFWTSRGIAVLDVNYGGSSGYGREYRERLNDKWGVVDVDDCANGAKFLVARGDVDPDRLMITGGSAGGYTTLCALTFRDTFKAGASHYGVSDAEALTAETHKFESRYLDRLFGPYPERRDIYYERSPINFTEQLSCPVIFFQGLEDRVVPPNQAELMVAALQQKGVPVAYVAFAGEQHGFRQAQNIKRSLEGELYFYSRVFGFELADPVEPLQISNL
ncbi:MAG TPA: S9 family peptidase [Pyrinomonadaceae bacterium]|nr:S9 family peptidase [Pyrinomonadaceae bacterium]